MFTEVCKDLKSNQRNITKGEYFVFTLWYYGSTKIMLYQKVADIAV